MELTSGLYSVISVTASWYYQREQHFSRSLRQKLSFTRFKGYWTSWSLKHRSISRSRWFWRMRTIEACWKVGCLLRRAKYGAFWFEFLEMVSLLQPFTPTVITESPLSLLRKEETTFLEVLLQPLFYSSLYVKLAIVQIWEQSKKFPLTCSFFKCLLLVKKLFR